MTSIGPFGGPVSCVTIDPNNPSTIYSCVGNAFKSTNAGDDWSALDVDSTALVINPQDSNTIYAANSRGVSKSTDGGASWARLSLTLPIALLAIDSAEPNDVYAVCRAFDPSFWGLYKSIDGGGTWARINLSNQFIQAIALDPNHSGIAYVSILRPENGVLKSSDGGISWFEASAGLPSRS